MCTPLKTANLFDLYHYIVKIPVDDIDTPTIQSIRKEVFPFLQDYKLTFLKASMIPPSFKQQLLPHVKNTNLYLFFNITKESPFEIVRQLRNRFLCSKIISKDKVLSTEVTLPIDSSFYPSEIYKLQAIGIPSKVVRGLARTLQPFVFPKGYKHPLGLELLAKQGITYTIPVNPSHLFIKQSDNLYQIYETEMYFELETNMNTIFYDSFVEGILHVGTVTKHLSCENEFYNEASFMLDIFQGVSLLFQFELGAGLIELKEPIKEEPKEETSKSIYDDSSTDFDDYLTLFD